MAAISSALSKLNRMEQYPEGFRIEASKNQPDASKMFIGGLSRNISKQALLEYLSQFGEIVDFIIKIHPDTGLSRGFGFVLFKDSATVEKVLQVKEHKVDGKKIQLRKAKAMESKFPPRKVFVGGLNPRLSEEKIREYFGSFGVIENIELPVCPGTNERRAFCFITYTDEKPVRKLLETRYHLIGSGRCEVKIALPKEYTKPQRVGGRGVPFARLGNSWERKGFRADPHASRANQNVGGAVGGGESPSMVLVPVPFSACNEGFNFSHQMYGNFQNASTNQPVFNSYGREYFLGYNDGTRAFGTAFTNYNVQINQAAPFHSGYPGIYQPF
ncbi:heterogeneous nuclear ribonucleoprotein D-like [Diceros bicornis minor]|uniref:heterogeneous nuclear ribonucleoprotein D-like n=1 Tax=Diceros bicornis minor TaxID=77932 RepID=UPI0026EBC74F|nr:heterogeneous nuclear ribonucleoprotein D-like [Diceros bicornis minor]